VTNVLTFLFYNVRCELHLPVWSVSLHLYGPCL